MSYRKTGIAALGLLSVMFTVPCDAQDQGSKDGRTVSHNASSDPQFQWTLERMLLAQPMPMTQEGRAFISTHPSLDGIRTWNEAQFDKYLDSDYARRQVAEETSRWCQIARTLESQLTRGSIFLGKPVPERPKEKVSLDWDSLTVDQIDKMIAGKDRKVVFQRLKASRQEIAHLAPQVEALRKEAQAKGESEKLEQAMTPGQ